MNVPGNRSLLSMATNEQHQITGSSWVLPLEHRQRSGVHITAGSVGRAFLLFPGLGTMKKIFMTENFQQIRIIKVVILVNNKITVNAVFNSGKYIFIQLGKKLFRFLRTSPDPLPGLQPPWGLLSSDPGNQPCTSNWFTQQIPPWVKHTHTWPDIEHYERTKRYFWSLENTATSNSAIYRQHVTISERPSWTQLPSVILLVCG